LFIFLLNACFLFEFLNHTAAILYSNFSFRLLYISSTATCNGVYSIPKISSAFWPEKTLKDLLISAPEPGLPRGTLGSGSPGKEWRMSTAASGSQAWSVSIGEVTGKVRVADVSQSTELGSRGAGGLKSDRTEDSPTSCPQNGPLETINL
jgi:hypothetical protein